MCSKDVLLLIFVVVIIIFVVAGFLFVNHNNKKVRENFQTNSISEEKSEPTSPTLDAIIDCLNDPSKYYGLIKTDDIEIYSPFSKDGPITAPNVYIASNAIDANGSESTEFTDMFLHNDKDSNFNNALQNTQLPSTLENIKIKLSPLWSIKIFKVKGRKLIEDSNSNSESVIALYNITYNTAGNNKFTVETTTTTPDTPERFVILATKKDTEGNSTTPSSGETTPSSGETTPSSGGMGTGMGTETTPSSGGMGTGMGTGMSTGMGTGMGTGMSTGTTPSSGMGPESVPTTEPFVGNMVIEPFSNFTKNTGVQGITPDIGGSTF